MRELAELQDRFQRYIVHADEAASADIGGPDPSYRQARMAIYYQAYRLRLRATLAVDYPVLNAFLAQRRFRSFAANRYSASWPNLNGPRALLSMPSTPHNSTSKRSLRDRQSTGRNCASCRTRRCC